MIAISTQDHFKDILEVINDGASAYKGIIPADRWVEPYMSAQHLREQIDDGVQFWNYFDKDKIAGVMGIQDKQDVYLIRHAYVRTHARNKGIGGQLLHHLTSRLSKPVLIGTWADATWAIAFYEKHNFQLVSFDEKESLLRKYWDVPLRQIETSVVLASSDWTRSNRNE
jgi:N-acetylglutamate synthase-like GNAT family acetyltransferase